MKETQKIPVNREYKDRLFKVIFREKKDLLELYNAINDMAYDNPEDIEVNTMEDVVYIGMKNDLSFLLKDILNLYEHQSTFSPNFPLRGLFYFSDLYRKMVGNNSDLYSCRRIELPTPQFIIFYNGMQQEPERRILSLSDSFVKKGAGVKPSLECTALVLNINIGSNAKIMQKCKRLWEYSQFVGRVRVKLSQGMSIGNAVDAAVEECIKEDILVDILKSNREEVMNTLLTEYNEELHLKCEREIALEDGGMIKIVALTRKKMQKNMSASEIAEMLEEDVTVIEEFCRMLIEHPDWDDEEIYRIYYRKHYWNMD